MKVAPITVCVTCHNAPAQRPGLPAFGAIVYCQPCAAKLSPAIKKRLRLCGCGRPHRVRATTCTYCGVAASVVRHAEKIRARQEAGTCQCGAPRMPGRTLCEKCLGRAEEIFWQIKSYGKA